MTIKPIVQAGALITAAQLIACSASENDTTVSEAEAAAKVSVATLNPPKPAVADYEQFTLVFNDEFDQPQLDTTKWVYRTDVKHRSAQLTENVQFKDGKLVLDLNLLETPISKKIVASGAGIVSRHKYHYGYYEVRAKLGDGRDDDQDGMVDEGWHHAFWLMAAEITEADEVGTTYPDSRRTELDVYENPSENINEFQQHVIVWKENGKEWGRLPKPPTDLIEPENFSANDWHTYSAYYSEAGVKFYIDGELTKVADYPSADFVHDELNIWLTAISANWNNSDPEKSSAHYDYIRFYQK